MPDENNSWNKYQKLVLHELDRLNKCYESLGTRLTGIETEIAQLKVKSGMWGAVAGFIPAATAVLYILLKG